MKNDGEANFEKYYRLAAWAARNCDKGTFINLSLIVVVVIAVDTFITYKICFNFIASIF